MTINCNTKPFFKIKINPRLLDFKTKKTFNGVGSYFVLQTMGNEPALASYSLSDLLPGLSEGGYIYNEANQLLYFKPFSK